MTDTVSTGRASEPVVHLASSPGFVSRLSEGWGTPDRSVRVSDGMPASMARHRQLLSAALPGRTMAIHAGQLLVRNDDNLYPFRPDSNFFWLTGCAAEYSVLLMTPTAGGHDSTLFVAAPVYPDSPDFIDDRYHSELWVGAAPGPEEWSAALGIDVKPLSELAGVIERLGSSAAPLVAGRPVHPDLLGAEAAVSARLSQVISELRLIKDEWEIAEMRLAVDTTISGFEAVAAELPRAMRDGGERWLQGTFDRWSRTYGNGPGYLTIVGGGAHGAVLHWTRTDGPIRDGDLLLLDAGVETTNFYTSDVTRTFPINGTFTPEQRMAHDIVQKAHEAGLAAVGPGKPWTDFHYASMEVVAQGLHDWGLLPVSVDEALSDAGQHHRRYLICGIGHHLGLDVHDCSKADHDHYQGALMQPGMILTVEPGLYFHANDLTLPPELRGMGVRIEDDVLVTATGSENLSEGLPRDADGLEAWVRRFAG
jgi:Xaa-Pro aminopeptidase